MTSQASDVKESFSDKIPNLLVSHYEHLKSSAISDEVIKERGYETIFGTAKLERLSFAKTQQRHPGLLLPIYTVNGVSGGYQYKPDHPRDQIKPNGKAKKIKYENPAGSDIQIDVPPRCRQYITNPQMPIYLTEGIKKGDCLASFGACAISLMGVYGFKGTNPLGGKVINADLDAIAWNGRVVKIVYDSDVNSKPEVAKALVRLSTIVLRKGAARVDVIQLPGNADGSKNGVDDFLVQGYGLSDLDKLIIDPDIIESNSKRKTHNKPIIQCNNRQLRDVRADIMRCLIENNNVAPKLFVRGSALSCIYFDEDKQPYIDEISESALRAYMSDCADYLRIAAGGDETEITPPVDNVRDILAYKRWPFPPLVNITQVPVVRPDGTIFSQQGYDADTRLFYYPNGSKTSVISDNPTSGEVQRAIELVMEIIVDFPFDGWASVATCVSAMLCPIIRPLITGVTPLHVFDKTQAGTGASLLSDVVSIIATGKPSQVMSMPEDEESIRKTITSVLSKGQQVIVIDNVDRSLDSTSLAAVLTSQTWQDRLLGSTKMLSLPNKSVWIATGNNVMLRGDLPRRAIWTRMDAHEARPWLRKTEYTHNNLPLWVSENRDSIITAILTIVRAWVVAGKPVPGDIKILGGFESYCKIIGGILAFMGIKDFLTNIERMYDEADKDTPEWEVFLGEWHKELGDKGLTINELISYMTPDKVNKTDIGKELRMALPENLADINVKNYPRILGSAIRHNKGRKFSNGLILVKDQKEQHHYTTWKVVHENHDSPTFSLKGELGESCLPPTCSKKTSSKNGTRVNPIAAWGCTNSLDSPVASKTGESQGYDSLKRDENSENNDNKPEPKTIENNNNGNKTQKPCYSCGGIEYWTRGKEAMCSRCHPKPPAA